jgi:hypothetical protein
VTGLLRLIFGPSIRIAALVIARPLQLVEEALADVETEFDVDEPVPYVLPPADEDCSGWTLHDHTWLYELGAHL